MKENYVITIGRQLGSGGREIGQKLSVLLGISYYDKELIRIASKESGLKEELFEEADEKKTYSLFGELLGLKNPLSEDFSAYYLSNEALFKIQSDIIRELSSQKSCLFVGRCSDYILKNHPRCLNIFILADMKDRIKRIARTREVNENKARELIEKTDKTRGEYYNYFSDKQWGSVDSYHLCINSSVLGIDDTVLFLRQFAEMRFTK